MTKPEPIFIANLLSKIDNKLIELLKGLSIQDWSLQTIAPKWKVKDVAAHLLDGNIRTLSILRDHYQGDPPGKIDSYSDLVQYLNTLNADWVKAMKRISPTVLVQLLEITGKQYCHYLESLDPFDKAVFPVGWAGEKESLNWFHIAREYTEKWHHQQQIRYAVGQEEVLLAEEWYFPYLDTSVKALPYHYRAVSGNEGDLIKFVFYGESEKIWFLKWENSRWELYLTSEDKASCEVRIKDTIAWKIFTKGMKRQEAMDQSEIIGKKELGRRIFELIAVMA